MRSVSAHIVLARYLARLADQIPGARRRMQQLTNPINKPRGVTKEIIKGVGENIAPDLDEITDPDRKDIQPKDVFKATPNNVGVLNLLETGEDLTKVQKKIDRDKGHDVVDNLSQYLIRTEGGGSGGPEGREL